MKFMITKCPNCDGPMAFDEFDAEGETCFYCYMPSHAEAVAVEVLATIEGEERAASSIVQMLGYVADQADSMGSYDAALAIRGAKVMVESGMWRNSEASDVWPSFPPRGPESPREIEVE